MERKTLDFIFKTELLWLLPFAWTPSRRKYEYASKSLDTYDKVATIIRTAICLLKISRQLMDYLKT